MNEQDEQQIRELLEKTNDQLRFGDRPKNHLQQAKGEKYAPVVLDVVFRFEGYFKEQFVKDNRGPFPGVIDSDSQDHSVHHVVISYFLEDDSISVVEPPVKNSGVPQGVLLKRQRIPKPRDAMIGMYFLYYYEYCFSFTKSL